MSERIVSFGHYSKQEKTDEVDDRRSSILSVIVLFHCLPSECVLNLPLDEISSEKGTEMSEKC